MRQVFIFLTIVYFFSINMFAGNPPGKLERKAARIHREVMTLDSHTDTPSQMLHEGFNMNQRHDPRTTHSRVDFVRMKEGGLDAAFFAVFVSQGSGTPEGYEKAKSRAMLEFDSIHAVLKRYPEVACLALTAREGKKVEKEGKIAVFIGIENGYVIGRDLSLISTYFLKGARYITLCHTRNNDICDSSNDTVRFNGISSFGKEVVAEMNRLGIMVDVSHASDKSFYDVLSVSRLPVIASHSCARALCDNPRNLDDEMLKALAKNGGVIQMCILSEYVKKSEPDPRRDSARKALRIKYHGYSDLSPEEAKNANREWNEMEDKYPQKLATVQDMVDHIDHIVGVAGINHVGIGTDFDGGGGLEDCMDASQMGNVTLELVKRGYSKNQIRKIWGGNLLRVMKANEKYAAAFNKDCACH